MLQTDEKILKILLHEKRDEDNKVLKHFKINYPSNNLAQNSNNIFVACVSYEETGRNFDTVEGKDLVEILIVTKKVDNKAIRQTDYSDVKFIIKTVMKEIQRILLLPKYRQLLHATPVFRNISPEYNNNYQLNRGHMLVELKTVEKYDAHSLDCMKLEKLLLETETYVTTDDFHEKGIDKKVGEDKFE